MRFLLLAIALLVISLTPPVVAESSDGGPETVTDAPTAVSQEDEVKIRERIKEGNDKMSYYDMHFGLKEIEWNVERRQKDVKKLNEMLTKNEAKAAELKQNQIEAANKHAVLKKEFDENLEMKEYNKNLASAEEAGKAFNISKTNYDKKNSELKKNQTALGDQKYAKEYAIEQKEIIENPQRLEDLKKYLNNMGTRTKDVIQLDINAWTTKVADAKTERTAAITRKENSAEAVNFEKLKCAIVIKKKPNEDPCKTLEVRATPLIADVKAKSDAVKSTEKKLKEFEKERDEDHNKRKLDTEREIRRIETMSQAQKTQLITTEAEAIKKADDEINRLIPIIDQLELDLMPLEDEMKVKEDEKTRAEALTTGGAPAGGLKMEETVKQSSAELKLLEEEQADVVETIPVIKESIVKENYEYYYLTEKLKDVINRREKRTEELKQMQFNWPREYIKLVVIWFILFVLPAAFIAYGVWKSTTGDSIGAFPFGPKPYWLHWYFGNREHWSDLKEREIGDRNTHQQPYREGPEMWWPLKPWDIYRWIVVKVKGLDEPEEEWDDDPFLRSDPFQREILLRGEEYREDAQWDGAYSSLQAHYDDFNEAYLLFNQKENATKYKIVNPEKMAGAYGPMLDKRKKYRHPDHKYPLYVPPPPPPMRPAKRIPRLIPLVIKPPETKSWKETEWAELNQGFGAGPVDIVNYDGETLPKRKYWDYYVRLHHRMRKEGRLFCYKPWTRKWINDHFANYHDKPNHSVTGGSKKRRRKRGRKRVKKVVSRSTAGRETSTTTTRKKFNKKHHRKHHVKTVKAGENNGEKQKLKALHKKHCKRYRKRVRIANLTAEQQKRLMKRGPRVLHRRIVVVPKKIRRKVVRGRRSPLKRILTQAAFREKKRDARKQKRAEKVKANPALLDAKHLKIRARKLRKHQARLRAENLRADLAEHERSAERCKKRHATQKDRQVMMNYKYHEKLQRDDTSDDPAEISEDEEERMNEEERAEYDPFPILLYPDPAPPRRTKHHKHCRFYERKKACQKGDKYAKLHAAKHNMEHDHAHLVSKRRVQDQECPPHCAHGGHGGKNAAVDSNRQHHEQKRAAKVAQGPKKLARLHTKDHIRRHHEMHHKRPHMPHVDLRTRIKWNRIKHDKVLWRKWNKDKIAEDEKEKEDEEERKREKSKKKDKKDKKDKKEKKKKDRKGPDGQPVISSIPDPDGWKMDKEEDEERQEEPTQVGTTKISVMPNEKLERLDRMPDTPEEATQALTKTTAERTLEDKTQAMGGDLEPPPTTNKNQWPLPPSAPIRPPVVAPEDDVTQDDKTATPAAATAVKKKSLPREDKPSKAGPPSTFRI